jgi:hypothetical protein
VAKPFDSDDLLQVAHRHGPDVRFSQQRVGIGTNNGFHRGTRKNVDQRRKLPTARQFENPLENIKKGSLPAIQKWFILFHTPASVKS